MTDKPNCLTCPHKIDWYHRVPEFWFCKLLKEELSPSEQMLIGKFGCLLHPGAREYLMKDVITELKHKQANAHGEISHHFFDDDCYREGIIKTCIEAISLIRDGVKK